MTFSRGPEGNLNHVQHFLYGQISQPLLSGITNASQSFLKWHELAAEEMGVGTFRISESRMSVRQILAEVALVQR